VDSGLARVIRFLAIQAVGLVNPVAGSAASAIDSFVLKRIIRGSSPKFFIERLDQLAGR